MADALLIGLVWWGGLWSLGGSVIGLIPAVGMVLVVASSPWIDADLASRLAGSLVIGCLGWIGVMPLLWSHASSPDWLHAWLMMGTGAGATIALLALMTDGLTRRGRPRLANTRPQAGVAPAVARKWGRWLVWGLALALTLRIAGAFLNWVSLIDHVRVLRGAARFDISVTVSLWTAFAVGIVGGVGGAAMIGLFGTFVGALLGVLQGLTGPDIERRTIPNQGIRQSVRNIGVFFLIGAVAVGVPFGLLNLASAWIYTGVFPDVDDLVRSVGNGAFIMGLLGGFVPGAVCLQHFTLRFVLWCQGAIPWRYVRFLDHATERMLLQRIGGRYRFIHVLLRDHLASKA